MHFAPPRLRRWGLFLDDFSTDQTTLVLTPALSASGQVSGGGIVGGERDATVTRVSGAGMSFAVSGGTASYGHISSFQGS